MARYYQTASPQFVEDFIYTPPYELMEKVAGKRQSEYDQAIANAKLLENIDIKHLNSEYDSANVAEKQRYYNDHATNIINAIKKDPMNATAYLGEIDKVKKELYADFTQGDISKITGSQANAAQWEKDNEDRKKKSPARYEAARNSFYNRWSGDSLDSQWKGQQVTEDVDWSKLYDTVDKLKASEWSETKSGASGGYIYKNKSTGEEVSADRINNHLLSRLITPENMAAMRQSEEFGINRYFDEDGNLDENSPGLAGLRGVSLTSAYKKGSAEQTLSSDGTWNNIYGQNQQNARQQAGFAHAKEMKNLDFQMDMEKERIKGLGDADKQIKELSKIAADTSKDPGLRQYAQNEISRLSGQNFIQDATMPDSYKNITGLFNANMKDPSVKSRAINTLTEISKTATSGEKVLFATLINKINDGKVTTKEQAIDVMTQKAWQLYNIKDAAVQLPPALMTIIKNNNENKKISNVSLGGNATVTAAPVKTYKADLRRGVEKLFETYNENSEKIIESKYSGRGTQFESAPLTYSATQANLQYFNAPETKNSFIYRDMLTGEEIKDTKGMSFNNYQIGSASGMSETGHILTNQDGKKILAISTDDNSNINNAIKYNAIRSLPSNSTIRNTLSNKYKQSIDTNFERAAPKEGNVMIDDPTGLTDMKVRRVFTPNSTSKAVYQAIDSYGNSQNFSSSDQLTEYLILSNQNK